MKLVQKSRQAVARSDMRSRITVACSVNYVVDFDDISIEDPTESLKTYEDEKTASGNKIQVRAADVYLAPPCTSYIPSQAWLMLWGSDSASFARIAEGKGSI